MDDDITECPSPTLSSLSHLTGILATLADIAGERTPDIAGIMTGMDQLDTILTEWVENGRPPVS